MGDTLPNAREALLLGELEASSYDASGLSIAVGHEYRKLRYQYIVDGFQKGAVRKEDGM